MAPATSSQEVIDLVHSDDEEEKDRKPAAKARPRNNNNNNNNNGSSRNFSQLFREQKRLLQEAEVIDLMSSSSEDEEDDDVIMSSKPPAVAAVARKRSRTDFESDMDEDLRLAMTLQRQEEEEMERYTTAGRKQPVCSVADDQKLAATLQRQEEEEAAQSKAQEQQQMLKTPAGKAYAFVERILNAVEEVTSSCPPSTAAAAAAAPRSRKHHDDGIEAVAKDDMVFMAETLFTFQKELRKQGGVDTTVDIGYHYTGPQHFKKIRENGLLTASERTANEMGNHTNGQVFGEGIYTANNCFSFSNFGNVGLLVARLKGKCSAKFHGSLRGQPGNEIHTVIGNKCDSTSDLSGLYDEIVLRKSNQVIPLVRFSRTSSSGSNKIDAQLKQLYDVLETVQEVVDEFCNDGRRTSVQKMTREDYSNRQPQYNRFTMPPAAPPPPTFNPLPPTMNFAVQPPLPTGLPSGFSIAQPSPGTVSRSATKRRSPGKSRTTSVPGIKIVPAAARIEKVIEYKAPSSLKNESLSNLKKVPPEESKKLEADNADCAICICPLVEDTQGQTRRERRDATLAQLPCGHIFHRGCILSAISSLGNRCPYKCAALIGPPQGKCPSGTMSVTKNKGMHCSGYENDTTSNGTIVIQYHIPKTSKQMSYHPSPGKKHSGAHRTCYLPDTKEGNELLLRLQFAFRHGLTFTIGTSMTTGQSNSVTWASIHHKTSFTGGSRSFGFPDPSYFSNCSKELDDLNVPKTEELLL